MKNKSLVVFVVLAVLAVPVALAKVSVDYDRDVDFAQFKTYAWMDGTPAGSDLVERRIHEGVEGELGAKGMTKADGEPDVLVVTHVSVEGQTRVDVDNFGYGGYWRGYGMSTVHVTNFDVGTLMVDMLDAKTKTLIWRGVATKTLPSNPKPEKIDKLVSKIIGKMFKKFPPGSEN